MTALAATALYSSGIAFQNGQGGNSHMSVGATPTQQATPTKGVDVGGGVPHRLYGINPASGNVYFIDEGAGTSTQVQTTTTRISGMSKLPGTRTYYLSGGMTDGGNIYIANPGSALLVGNSGLGAVSGLAFDPADSRLYGTYTASVLSDGLCEINPTNGTGTPIGFMGIGGMDSLAIDPTSGTMYGSTGFFYDGSPGDVITINKVTGAATDGGQDMNPQPPSTVAGMAFAGDGSGYVSIGAGNGSVYSWDTGSNSISSIVDNATFSNGSMSDIDVAR
ncbi:MAG: hypothetical protein AAF682_03320 [Planctomycetota bacterium]